VVELFGIVLARIGLVRLVRGAELITLGGSWYYAVAGVLLALSGIQVARRKVSGAWWFALVFVGTVAWSLWEVGTDFWPLVPRLAPVLVLGLILALMLPALTAGRVRKGAYALALILAVVIVAGGASMFKPHGVVQNQFASASDAQQTDVSGNWQFYGNTSKGTRFVAADEINPENVDGLEVAWTFRTGEMAENGTEFQNTPTQIGDTVYVCTALSKVFALDADTGEERWTFDPKTKSTGFWNRCRGVGYYEPSAVTQPVHLGDAAQLQTDGAHQHGDGAAQLSNPRPEEPAGVCEQRIVLTTVDAR